MICMVPTYSLIPENVCNEEANKSVNEPQLFLSLYVSDVCLCAAECVTQSNANNRNEKCIWCASQIIV